MVGQRVAVLVDGDNISATHAAQVLAKGAGLGRVDVSRVYGSATRPSGWLTMPGYRVMQAGVGKNAADVLLCIDAMELALGGDFDTFVIATSDGDFTHIAQRLRERGLHVLGIGCATASKSFRLACSDFAPLQVREVAIQVAAAPKACACSDLDRNIQTMIAQHSKDGRGMRIADLGAKMHVQHSIQIKSYPEGSWRAYLSQRPSLYDMDPRGPAALVRFRPTGFAAS